MKFSLKNPKNSSNSVYLKITMIILWSTSIASPITFLQKLGLLSPVIWNIDVSATRPSRRAGKSSSSDQILFDHSASIVYSRHPISDLLPQIPDLLFLYYIDRFHHSWSSLLPWSLPWSHPLCWSVGKVWAAVEGPKRWPTCLWWSSTIIRPQRTSKGCWPLTLCPGSAKEFWSKNQICTCDYQILSLFGFLG